jgi:hypothetical protein
MRTIFSADTGVAEIFLSCGSAYPVPPEYLRLYYFHCLVTGVVPDILEEDAACQWSEMDRA